MMTFTLNRQHAEQRYIYTVDCIHLFLCVIKTSIEIAEPVVHQAKLVTMSRFKPLTEDDVEVYELVNKTSFSL
jgi:hypothetical protein